MNRSITRPLSRIALSAAICGGACTAFLAAPSSATTLTPQQQYVSWLYNDLLGRSADAGGLSYYSTLLGSTAPPSTTAMQNVVTQILNSSEFDQDLVRGDYQSILGRSADPSGLTYWSNYVAANGWNALEVQLLASNEFYVDAGGTFNGWLSKVYSVVLDRGVDSGGLAYWTAEQSSGTSLSKIATSIVTSREAEVDAVSSYYTTYLRRAGDTTGIAYWTGLEQQGQSPLMTVVDMLSMPEYYGYTQTHSPS